MGISKIIKRDFFFSNCIMPYKRKYAARKIQRNFRRYRGRKYARHPHRGISRSTGLLKCIQSFSRLEPIPAQPLTTGSFTASQEVYSLDQVSTQNLTAFQRLFKFWKIDKVEHTFVLKYLNGTSAPVGETQPQMLIAGNFMSSITLDSNQLAPTTPNWTNVDQAEESGNLKKKYLSPQTGNRAVAKVTLVPRTNNWIRTTASSNNSSVAIGAKQFISTQTPGTQLYGLRWAYEVLNSHGSCAIEVRSKLFFTFKGVN